MSRCSICDTLLTKYELAIRYNAGHELSDNFEDVCTSCLTAMTEQEEEALGSLTALDSMITTQEFSTVVISNYSCNTEED